MRQDDGACPTMVVDFIRSFHFPRFATSIAFAFCLPREHIEGERNDHSWTGQFLPPNILPKNPWYEFHILNSYHQILPPFSTAGMIITGKIVPFDSRYSWMIALLPSQASSVTPPPICVWTRNSRAADSDSDWESVWATMRMEEENRWEENDLFLFALEAFHPSKIQWLHVLGRGMKHEKPGIRKCSFSNCKHKHSCWLLLNIIASAIEITVQRASTWLRKFGILRIPFCRTFVWLAGTIFDRRTGMCASMCPPLWIRHPSCCLIGQW